MIIKSNYTTNILINVLKYSINKSFYEFNKPETKIDTNYCPGCKNYIP